MPRPRNNTPQADACPCLPEPDQGIYVLRIRLSAPLELTVGALPKRHHDPGTYWYVGSAQRNLQSRISRHLKTDKKLRWHIDHFLANPEARIEAVFAKPAAKSQECATARSLGHHGEPVPRFGASDCRCSAHLIHTTGNATQAAEALLLKRGFVRTPLHHLESAAFPDQESQS